MNKLVVDAHLDIAYNAIGFGRDYAQSVSFNRTREEGTPTGGRGICSVGLPELIEGRVGIIFGTIFQAPLGGGMSMGPIRYQSPAEAHRSGMAQLDYYHMWAKKDARVRVIGSRAQLDETANAWLADSSPQAQAQPPAVGIIPLLEGADAIREPAELGLWLECGLHIVGLAWTGTRYAGGTRAPGGITDLGRALLDEMARLGVILDVSHLAQQALVEALDYFKGEFVIASHSNPQVILPTERHLPDAAIKRIGERGGVIGAVLANGFLQHEWSGEKDGKAAVTVEHIVRVIDHVCQITGSDEHIGIGSDFDGGFGVEGIPDGFDSSRDLYKIGDALAQHGYSAAQIDKVLHGNWLRLLRKALR